MLSPQNGQIESAPCVRRSTASPSIRVRAPRQGEGFSGPVLLPAIPRRGDWVQQVSQPGSALRIGFTWVSDGLPVRVMVLDGQTREPSSDGKTRVVGCVLDPVPWSYSHSSRHLRAFGLTFSESRHQAVQCDSSHGNPESVSTPSLWRDCARISVDRRTRWVRHGSWARHVICSANSWRIFRISRPGISGRRSRRLPRAPVVWCP